jgi:hypothetical protein
MLGNTGLEQETLKPLLAYANALARDFPSATVLRQSRSLSPDAPPEARRVPIDLHGCIYRSMAFQGRSASTRRTFSL